MIQVFSALFGIAAFIGVVAILRPARAKLKPAPPVRAQRDPLPPAREVKEIGPPPRALTAEDYRQKDRQPIVSMVKLEREIIKPVDRLSDAKAALRAMTYGEFMEHCRGMGSNPKKVWAYATDAAEIVPQLRMAA